MVGVVTKTDIVNQMISRCIGFGCTTRVESVMMRDITYCRANELLHGGIWRQSETGRWTDEFLLGAVSGDRIVPPITAAMPIKAQPLPPLELMIAGPEGGPSSDMQRYEG